MGAAEPPRSCCAPCSAMLLACPKALTSTFPDRENNERQPVTTVRFLSRTASARIILCSDPESKDLHATSYVQEFLAGLNSTWDDFLMRWTLGIRNALEESEALPPFPTAAWTLGSQNVFEAGNESPPSLTATGVTPEGTEPALESYPSAAGATLPEGAAPASEGDSRVRGQAEPGGADYVAAEKSSCGRTQGCHGGVTLAPSTETAQRHPSGGENHGGRNVPGARERPFRSGSDTTGRCGSSVQRRPGGKGADGAMRCCFCSHGKPPNCRKQGGDVAGTLAPAPNTAQRRPSNIWSDRVHVPWYSRG